MSLQRKSGFPASLLLRVGMMLIALTSLATASGTAPPSGVFLRHLLPGLGEAARDYSATTAQTTITDSARLAAQRADLLAKAQRASTGHHWDRAAHLYRQRLALGDQDHPALWLALATAESSRIPPKPKAIEAAAFLAYTDNEAHGADPAIARPALQLIADALRLQGNALARIDLLTAMQHAYPKDPTIRQALASAVKSFSVHVTRLRVEADQFPTQTCITLNVKPTTAPDFHIGDWVGIEPAIKGTAITVQNGAICLAGLPPGQTSTVILRQGLPLQAGTRLPRTVMIPVAIGNRKPQLITDVNRYLIPATSPAAIGLATVNLQTVHLKIVRVAERSLVGFFSNHPLLNPVSEEPTLNGNYGRTVWQGNATIPGYVPNKLIHAVVKLPAVMQAPGLYAIAISPPDTVQNRYQLDTMQLVLRTDMAPIVWHGADGLHVQIRKFTTADPFGGVKVDLIAQDNAILGTATTNNEGIARFPAPLLAGGGGEAPIALHIRAPDGDFTVFNLDHPALDLSDRGISGRPMPPRIDPYLWLDRGIFRPGETVRVTALYRTDRGAPIDLPLHLIIRRPAGQVYFDKVVPRADDDSIAVPIKLPDAAQAGNWSVSLAMGVHDPALAQRSFTVAAFVPPKIKVSLGQPQPIATGRIDHWNVNARFLYGAPGSNLTGTATLRLIAATTPFPQWKAYSFGLHGEIFESALSHIALPETGPNGNTTVPIDLTDPPDTTHAIAAKLSVSINDPSGRAVTSSIVLPVTPPRPLIGIKEDFSGGTVGNKVAPQFDLAAIGPDGMPVPMKVTVSLVRQETEWHIYFTGSQARWAVTHIDRPVQTTTLDLTAGKPVHFSAPVLDWGRYRLRVVQAAGGFAASSVVFYSGWATSANPAVPQRVMVSADHRLYPAGAVAQIHVAAPFHGPATLVIANDRVLAMRNFNLPAGGTTLNVNIGTDWGPGAYAIVDAFHKPGATRQPARAVGLTWIGVKPGKARLAMSLPVKKIYRPGRDITFAIHARPGAYVTLAAVDEGILNLTDFASPDPTGHFFGQRRLGVSIMDDYAALLLPPTGATAILKNGAGANFGPAIKPVPQRIVSLFAGPVRAGADGIAKITLHVPEFNGEIRLMAVGWTAHAVGAVHQRIIVRNRVIANALLPRFLAPGDRTNAGLMVQNLDLPAGNFTAILTASGPLTIDGGATATRELAPGARHILRFGLDAARREGTGTIDLKLTGPDYTLKRHWIMTVHSARAPVTRLATTTIAPGTARTIGLDAHGLFPGSVQSTVTFGNTLPFDPAEYMQALAANHLPFLTQSVSRGFPLTVLHGPVAGPDPRAALARAVQQVLDLQRFDGSFGLWSSHDLSEPWLTAYATEFLLRARKAGAYVPDVQIDQALTWLRHEVEEQTHSDFSRVYAAYVLGLAGQPPAGAIRRLSHKIDAFHMPLTRAQLGAALNDIGEPDQARAGLHAALAIHNRLTGDWWYLDQDWQNAFGSPLRDAWAVPAVIAQTGLLRRDLPALRANLPGMGIAVDTLNAQELAWACFADGVLGAPPPPMDFRLDGQTVRTDRATSRALTHPAQVDNVASTALAVSVATTGIPDHAPQAASSGMIVSRHFYTLTGTTLDPDVLTQNTSFIMVISGRARDSAPHRVVLDAGLPAGWELSGNISSGKTATMRWLGALTHPRIRAAADDRYEAAFDLAPPQLGFFGNDNGVDREFRVAIMIRAVTQGHFTLPGVTLSDMFHPMVFARTAGGHVTVVAAGQSPPKASQGAAPTTTARLKSADTALTKVYAGLMHTLPPAVQRNLRRSETNWIIAKRAACGTQATAMQTPKGRACLLDQTQRRIAALRHHAGPGH